MPEHVDLMPSEPWGETKREFDYAQPKNAKWGRLSIEPKSAKIVAGDTGKLAARFVYYRSPHDTVANMIQFYNPHFDKFKRPPSFALAAFDLDHRFVEDLAWCDQFGKRFVSPTDFTYLEIPGTIIGGGVDIPTRRSEDDPPPFEFPRLPIGRFLLQVILFDRFCPINTMVAEKPPPPEATDIVRDPKNRYGLGSETHDEYVNAWLKRQPGNELLRSNIIEIEVVAPGKK